jgi:hypothetical protein
MTAAAGRRRRGDKAVNGTLQAATGVGQAGGGADVDTASMHGRVAHQSVEAAAR